MRTRRELLPARMLEQTGAGRRLRRLAVPPTRRLHGRAEKAETRIETLRKLESLFDSGVLTRQQYESERRRLLGG
ncbi:MAG: SHOCT domain-containing protein [Actinobacteria bacterium]|nr:SHOCT domain-containing protein [Actinomycetota bacterium]